MEPIKNQSFTIHNNGLSLNLEDAKYLARMFMGGTMRETCGTTLKHYHSDYLSDYDSLLENLLELEFAVSGEEYEHQILKWEIGVRETGTEFALDGRWTTRTRVTATTWMSNPDSSFVATGTLSISSSHYHGKQTNRIKMDCVFDQARDRV